MAATLSKVWSDHFLAARPGFIPLSMSAAAMVLFLRREALLPIKSRNAYSKMAARTNTLQEMIQSARAVVAPLALGVSLATELRVLIRHRNRVSSRPSRPGMASGGIKKLI